MEDLQAIAVDPTQQRLYYSDCSRSFSHIGICDMAVETCSTVTFGAPHRCVTSLAVDVREKRVYWSDPEGTVISSADVTGKDIVTIKHSMSPTSVAVLADRVFWTDPHYRDVLYHRRSEKDSLGKIAVNLSPLTSVAGVDVNAQPLGDNVCTRSNGACSHICIPFSQTVPRCRCPSPMVLGSDRKTCKELEERGATPTRRAPVFITRPSTTRAYLLWGLPGVDVCADGFCENGGTCTMYTGRATCICPRSMSGARCQNVTMLSSSDRSYVTDSHVWVPVLAAVLAVVFISALVVVVYILRRNGYLNKPPSVVQFKTVIFGSSSDNDEHKAKLVNPTYENPGYVDVDDDELSERHGPARPSAPTATLGELASAGQNEYTYIRKVDTADP